MLRLRGHDESFGGGPAASALVKAAGNFCFSFSTGANRSPSRLIRFTAASGVKKSASAFLRFTAFASSSHVTGIEMNGSPSFARIA